MPRTVFAKGISKTITALGALTFFFGDRALREIWHWRFVSAELCGIGGGILLMILGGTIHFASFEARRKSRRTYLAVRP
jgi:hypothetical protein